MTLMLPQDPGGELLTIYVLLCLGSFSLHSRHLLFKVGPFSVSSPAMGLAKLWPKTAMERAQHKMGNLIKS